MLTKSSDMLSKNTHKKVQGKEVQGKKVRGKEEPATKKF